MSTIDKIRGIPPEPQKDGEIDAIGKLTDTIAKQGGNLLNFGQSI